MIYIYLNGVWHAYNSLWQTNQNVMANTTHLLWQIGKRSSKKRLCLLTTKFNVMYFRLKNRESPEICQLFGTQF